MGRFSPTAARRQFRRLSVREVPLFVGAKVKPLIMVMAMPPLIQFRMMSGHFDHGRPLSIKRHHMHLPMHSRLMSCVRLIVRREIHATIKLNNGFVIISSEPLLMQCAWKNDIFLQIYMLSRTYYVLVEIPSCTSSPCRALSTFQYKTLQDVSKRREGSH